MDHTPGFLRFVEARRAAIDEVAVDDARHALAGNDEAMLIDVREDKEYDAAHAVGAQHIGRGVIERDIERLVPDKDRPLYLYCGGGFRSILAASSLQEMGYTNVHSIIGGWRGWQEAGAPVETSIPENPS
jgi:rhodanese-related sulfurtransferase